MRCGIGLGSNVGGRLATLIAARKCIATLAGPALASSVWETEPVGMASDASPFLNAVLEVGWTGEVLDLLHALLALERDMGRPSLRPRNASRLVDLDLLYAGEERLHSEPITLPHPRLHERRFVLAPLAEIRPDLLIPGQSATVEELLRRLHDPAGARIHTREWNP